MHNIRFLLRDTQPASEAREDMAKFHRRLRKKKGQGVKSPVDAYPGDIFFLLLFSSVRSIYSYLCVCVL